MSFSSLTHRNSITREGNLVEIVFAFNKISVARVKLRDFESRFLSLEIVFHFKFFNWTEFRCSLSKKKVLHFRSI